MSDSNDDTQFDDSEANINQYYIVKVTYMFLYGTLLFLIASLQYVALISNLSNYNGKDHIFIASFLIVVGIPYIVYFTAQ